MQLPRSIVKARSRRLTTLVDSFTASYQHLVGTVQRVCVTDTAADGHHLVAHTKSYVQVLVVWPSKCGPSACCARQHMGPDHLSSCEQVLLPPAGGLLGSVVLARIVAASRWSVSGEVVPTLPQMSIAERAEQPASSTAASSDACDCNGADNVSDSRTCKAATAHGIDIRLPLPSMPQTASIAPGTLQSGRNRTSSRSEDVAGDRLSDAAQLPTEGQRTAFAGGALACSSSMISAVEVRLRDSPAAASSGAASAGALAAITSVVKSTASAAASAIQQPARAITVVRGGSADSALRTAGNKQDFVDVLLALGVVLGLAGVLVVSSFDLIASVMR